MSRRRSLGFTLIEFLIALILGMLVVTVGLWLGYQNAQDAQVQELQTAIGSIVNQANATYATNVGYQALDGTTPSMPSLYALNSRLPYGIVNETANQGTPTAAQVGTNWGPITVGVASTTTSGTPACQSTPVGPANDLLTITVSNLPDRACAGLITAVSPTMYDSYVNNSLVGLVPNGMGDRLGVNQAQAGPLCTGNNNTVEFRSLKPLQFADLRNNPITTTMTAAEQACVVPQYTRIQNAMTARETAQNAL
jgi:type II secretory pathway pseudopilin PulG